MKRTFLLMIFSILLYTNIIWADTFGTGDNQFIIDFVTISGDASSANGTYIGGNKSGGFLDPGYDYRMGTYEITNYQWDKFMAECGTVIGSQRVRMTKFFLYGYWRANQRVSYEAAQFVNWLNSTGHEAAYNPPVRKEQ